MPRLTTAVRSALADWWNLASDAAHGGYTTTDLVQAAADLARQAGRALAFAESTALATLFGYAKRMVNAGSALRAAFDHQVIVPAHIAIPPWARDEAAQNAYPIWHVTYTFSYIDARGVRHDEYRTSVFEVTFPQTVGQLRADVAADAQALADKYGIDLLSAELHQILAV